MQPPPASRPSGAGRWVALGAGLFMLALVVVTGVVVVTAVAKGGEAAASGGDAAEAGNEAGAGAGTEGGSDGGQDGSAGGAADGATDGDDGLASEPGGQSASDPHEGVAAYTGPDTPTQVAVGPGPHRLPADACAAVGPQTLEGLGMGEEPTRSESSEGTAPSRSCMWQQLADDGSFHVVRVRYESADTPELAAAVYDAAAEEQTGILGEVVRQEEPGIGDESTVVLVDNGKGAYQGLVFVRLGNTVVTVEREIQPQAGGTGAPTLAWGPTSQLMPELGRQALNNLA
ncbi:hypothetical protein O4J56_18555 [Nocardiopsis sp. RSe5-2]|uniref:DUF3558 domain-containing protein n=1 Tax=Nocardiopsis endophytica TaxID=3018445 RepID=A0ABT4U8I8_9ACTN|nr:hypothetical protein [Nocardiopsis endophytica]MDA2812652.1 hypothetical protein [Nocardiopsis endophytica]